MVESRHFNNIIHAHTEAGHDLSGFLFQRDVKTYQKKTEGGYQEGHFRIGGSWRSRWSQKVIQLDWAQDLDAKKKSKSLKWWYL